MPLATYETPLWASTNRGAKVSQLCGGINATVISDSMTRSFVVEAPTAALAAQISVASQQRQPELIAVLAESSRYAVFQKLDTHQVGNLLRNNLI